MIRVKKGRRLKLHRNTTLYRVMAKPAMRFFCAGLASIIITVLLFLFMIYITENFNKYSSMNSEMLFDLDTMILEQDSRKQRIRVRPPPELEEELESPELQNES